MYITRLLKSVVTLFKMRGMSEALKTAAGSPARNL